LGTGEGAASSRGLGNASNGVLYYGLENELGTAAPGI
jgi:hypothetical protein